jgi:hypothetical protein
MLKYTHHVSRHCSIYRRHSVRHRVDSPAELWRDGHIVWYEYGKYHRPVGPAIIYHNGDIDFWIRGKRQC